MVKVALLLACLASVALAQTPRDRLTQAEVTTSLDQPGLKPWHLTLAVQFFDEKGSPQETGTIERWYAGPKLQKTIYNFPSFQNIALIGPSGAFRSKPDAYPPRNVQRVLDQVTHPLPSASALELTAPELRKQSFGKLQLDCVLAAPLKVDPYRAPSNSPTYCFDPVNGQLLLSLNAAGEAVFRNKTGLFQHQSIATDLTLRGSNGKNIATMQVTALQTTSLADDFFQPTPDILPFTKQRISLAGKAGAPRKLSGDSARYPESAKANHISGTVVLHAVIGIDGKIKSLELVSSPDLSLTNASLEAVRKWTYEPYQLDGVPVEVETDVVVHFSIG